MTQSSFGQMDEGMRSRTNQQIKFLNESVHGMLVAHRIIERFNNDVNKYVDLPSYTIYDIQNSDVPGDIFQDPERLFYDMPPGALYSIITSDPHKSKLPANTLPIIDNVRGQLRRVNSVRLDLESILYNDDINQLATLQKAYFGLENAIDHYENIRKGIQEYESAIAAAYYSPNLPENKLQVYTALLDIHQDIKRALAQIRSENQSSVIQIIPKIDKELNWLNSCINELPNQQEKVKLRAIFNLTKEIAGDLRGYLSGSGITQEYAAFGKGYYYHNIKVLTKINRYGNGYVSLANAFFDEFNWQVLHLLEEPHFVKVVYPKRIDVETLHAENIDERLTVKKLSQDSKPSPIIVEKAVLPMPNRDLIKLSKTIIPDSQTFELELFDHRIKDGDLVSINVNGKWVHENISLEHEPKKIQLTIDPNLPNVILIQAVNTGWRPPSTVGVRYLSKGEGGTVFFHTDLKSSEVLEIKYGY